MGVVYDTGKSYKLVDPGPPSTWDPITHVGFLRGSFRAVNFTEWEVKWKLILP